MDATKGPACEIQIADQGLDFTTLPGPVPRALTGELVARMAGHAVVKAVDRMVWSSNWLFNEINRQLDEQDPELDELWEEQKREEGIE